MDYSHRSIFLLHVLVLFGIEVEAARVEDLLDVLLDVLQEAGRQIWQYLHTNTKLRHHYQQLDTQVHTGSVAKQKSVNIFKQAFGSLSSS